MGKVEERGWAYRRRQPEGTVVYEAVRHNLATLLAEASEVGLGLPWYVERAQVTGTYLPVPDGKRLGPVSLLTPREMS